jgi:hypothetical protein
MASGAEAPFDEADLLADARRRTGLEDFGDEGFREPLRMLLASLSEAPLNAVGTMVLGTSIRRSLRQRLLARDLLARHPEIEEERIEAPLVVVGMMRSGTTLLQRLLARDERFLSALGWEIGEPVPRPGHEDDDPDPRIAAGREQTRLMREFAPQLHAIHPTDAMEPDEEIVFLADAFLSHIPEASCHVPAYRAWLDDQDFTPAYAYLRTMLQLLQWQKRRRGEPGGRWLLKTPAHLGYLDTLFATFPDAHVVHMHRSPLETIPSGASLNLTLWRMYADEADPHEIGRQWIQRMAWATDRALAFRASCPDEAGRFTDVGYRDAVTDPIGQVRRIHGALGLELPDSARAAMEGWLAADRGAKRPAHRYTAEAFGLSADAIREAFAAYTSRFAEHLDGGSA